MEMKREITVENAIYINDIILCYAQEEHGYFGVEWCGVVPEYISRLIIERNVVRLEYDEPWEDYIRSWEIPIIYFSMNDEAIVNHALESYKAQQDFDNKQELQSLERHAKMLGYKLVKIEGE
jgi:hypothetical protein